MTVLGRLRRANTQRAAEWYGETLAHYGPIDWSNAMCGEAGEVANVVKKLKRHDVGIAPRSAGTPEREALERQLAAELADVIIYADLLAAEYGIGLWDAIRAKFNATSERNGQRVRL